MVVRAIKVWDYFDTILIFERHLPKITWNICLINGGSLLTKIATKTILKLKRKLRTFIKDFSHESTRMLIRHFSFYPTWSKEPTMVITQCILGQKLEKAGNVCQASLLSLMTSYSPDLHYTSPCVVLPYPWWCQPLSRLTSTCPRWKTNNTLCKVDNLILLLCSNNVRVDKVRGWK